MIKNIGMMNEHPDMPENYSMTFNFVGGKTKTFECASHMYIDKVWNQVDGKYNCVGIHPNPFYEIWTTENKMRIIVTSAVESIDFDDNWSKMVSIKNKVMIKKKAESA